MSIADTQLPTTQRCGPTSLLILQSVELCNLDCAYCYLPNRSSNGRMNLKTVEASIRWLVKEDLLADQLEILWHAGEPLLAGLDFYQKALGRCAAAVPRSTAWNFAFQTNATLIDRERATHSKFSMSYLMAPARAALSMRSSLPYAYMKGWKSNDHIDFNFYDAHDLRNLTARASEETVKKALRESLWLQGLCRLLQCRANRLTNFVAISKPAPLKK